MSEQTKHTEGPWVLCHDGAEIHDRKMKQDGTGAWIGERPNLIAEVGHFNREANGPLLVLAPDMLDMLKKLAERATYSGRLVGWDSDTLDAMKKLIARAESRQPVEAQ